MFARIKRYVAPPIFPEDDEKTRIASLLNVLLWALTVIFTINTINAFFLGQGFAPALINGATLLVNLGLLFTLRRHVKLAVWLTISVFFALITLIGFLLTGLSIIIITSYMVIVLLAGLLAGRSTAAGAAFLSIVIGGLMLYLELNGQLSLTLTGSRTINATAAGGNLIALTVILNLTLRDLNEALARMRQSNEALQNAQVLLESRVVERTRDLALAAEVAQNISQVHDLRTLLQDAVDLIRDRFQLYHVQIYLADENRNVLSLSAGTGQVGDQLVRRTHSLPFGPGSINGLAAAEKRAVVVSDTAVSPIFKPNALLPNTRSEMAVPLVASNVVVGSLNLQSDAVNGLNEENLPAFETLAGQLAIAIENVNLFSEISAVQAQNEAYLRRLTRQGWVDYLEAIQRPEKLGYTYVAGQQALVPDSLSSISPDKNTMQLPIVLGNEVVGTIELEADDEQFWTSDTLDMVTAVARQVGQQAENLRLLDEAERYRHEAEMAARRLQHDAWRNYLDRQSPTGQGFVYDQRQVKPLSEVETAGNGHDSKTLRQTLEIQGEAFGELVIDGIEGTEAQTLVTAVAEQLSSHLESLRLTAQTEQALAETAEQARRRAVLNQTSEQLNRAETLDDIFHIIAENTTQILPSDRVTLAVLTDDGDHFSVMSLAGTEGNVPVRVNQPLAGSFIEKAIQTDDILVTHDPQPNAETGIRSSMIVPLVTSSGTMGTLNVSSKAADVYDDLDRDLILQIASILSSVIENKRLLTETQKRAKELALINQVVANVSASLDMEQSLQVVADELAQAMGVGAIGIALMNDDKASLTVVAEYYDPERAASSMGYVIPIEGNALTQEVLRTRQTIVVEDAQNHPLTKPVHDGMRTRGVNTLYLIPMFAGDELVGTVGIDILEKGRLLSPQQSRLAETLIFQAATAVQNARLFAETQKRAEEMALINRIVSSVARSLNIEEALQIVAVELGRVVGVDQVAIALLNNDRKALTVLTEYKRSSDTQKAADYLIPIEGNLLIQEVLRSGKTVIVEDAQHHPLTESVREVMVTRGIETLHVLPMLVGEAVVGTVRLDILERGRVLDSHQINLAETIVYQAATAVQNARLFAESEERARQLAVLNEVAHVVSQQLDLKQLFTAVHEQIQRVIFSDAFFVAIYDADKQLVHLPFMFDDDQIYEVDPIPADPALEAVRVIQTGEPILMNYTPEEHAHEQATNDSLMATMKAPSSMLFVPLRSGSQIIGAISVQNYQFHPYTESDQNLLLGIANHVAVALENAHLFAAARRRAEREALINSISQKIQLAPTVQSALQTAVSELGQALKLKKAVVELTAAKQNNGHSRD